MRRRAVLEDEDQFMFRTVQRAHATIVLVPDAQVLESGVDSPSCGLDFEHVAPIHAQKMDRAVDCVLCETTEGRLQERDESFLRHFTGCHLELAVFHGAQARHMTLNWDIVRRIGKHKLRLAATEQQGVAVRFGRIPAQDAV